jgi:hypothetical protein
MACYMKRWFEFYYQRVVNLHQSGEEIRHQVGDIIIHQAGDELDMPAIFGFAALLAKNLRPVQNIKTFYDNALCFHGLRRQREILADMLICCFPNQVNPHFISKLKKNNF